jgi:hypothetical protein
MSQVELLDKLEVRVEPETVLKLQGYGDKRAPRDNIREIAARQVEAAKALVKPMAIYRELEIRSIEDSIVRLENDTVFQVGKRIANWWQGSNSVAIALCTIGSAIEEQVKALSQKGEHLAALTLDAAGSLALGSALDQVHRFTCERASKSGIRVGPSLNPGYAEWPLTDQRLIFQLMPAETIGVRLNEQCMMMPKQSAVLCAGLGVTQDFDDFNRCYHCGVPKCPFRKLSKKP